MEKKKYEVSLTLKEKEYLEESEMCQCGHLDVFHESCCYQDCNVDGCLCRKFKNPKWKKD